MYVLLRRHFHQQAQRLQAFLSLFQEIAIEDQHVLIGKLREFQNTLEVWYVCVNIRDHQDSPSWLYIQFFDSCPAIHRGSVVIAHGEILSFLTRKVKEDGTVNHLYFVFACQFCPFSSDMSDLRFSTAYSSMCFQLFLSTKLI